MSEPGGLHKSTRVMGLQIADQSKKNIKGSTVSAEKYDKRRND